MAVIVHRTTDHAVLAQLSRVVNLDKSQVPYFVFPGSSLEPEVILVPHLAGKFSFGDSIKTYFNRSHICPVSHKVLVTQHWVVLSLVYIRQQGESWISNCCHT